MHQSVLDFVTRVLGRDEVEGKRVLEVGALDVNGSVRPYVTSLGPAEYIGTDRRKGKGVDRVIPADGLVVMFWPPSFDVVISTEMLEHCRYWRVALYCMIAVLKTGGWLVLTTRSPGFPHHDHGGDFWRWNTWDLEALGELGELRRLEPDPQYMGVFLCWRKVHAVSMNSLDCLRANPAPPAVT